MGDISTGTPLRGIKILLVDDNDFNREITASVLQSNGAFVEECINGKDAVIKVKQSKKELYNYILMDIEMPVLDGYKATQKIRSLFNKKLSTIPIIAMTADECEEDLLKEKQAGFNAHLTKPFNLENFLNVLACIKM